MFWELTKNLVGSTMFQVSYRGHKGWWYKLMIFHTHFHLESKVEINNCILYCWNDPWQHLLGVCYGLFSLFSVMQVSDWLILKFVSVFLSGIHFWWHERLFFGEEKVLLGENFWKKNRKGIFIKVLYCLRFGWNINFSEHGMSNFHFRVWNNFWLFTTRHRDTHIHF